MNQTKDSHLEVYGQERRNTTGGKPLIQMNRRGTLVTATPSQIDTARAHFTRWHYLRLQGFLSPELLARCLDSINTERFSDYRHGGIGTKHRLSKGITTSMLDFLTNCPRIFRFIETVTGSQSIVKFTGRVFRMSATAGHFDSRHTDADRDRLVALSLNLSASPYEGGSLQI